MALKTFCVTFVLFVLLTNVFAATIFRKQRSIDKEESTENKEVCRGSTPCGWAIYQRFTRVIDYYMENTCVCPSDKKCIKSDDDISVSAYVYRCKIDS